MDGKWRNRTGHKRSVRERGTPKGGVDEWKVIWSKGTDAVMDVPLGGVCEILYWEGRDDSEEEIL